MAKLLIRHPLPGESVDARFLVAQGDCQPGITDLIGIIHDSAGGCVAKTTGSADGAAWYIAFENIRPGKGYCLEVRDAKNGDRLACVGPFDAHPERFDAPGMQYPGNNAIISTSPFAYGVTTATGGPVEGQVTSPGPVVTAWMPQSQGPPAGTYWIVPFSGLPTDNTASTSLTVRDTTDTTKTQTANNLTVQ